MPGALNHSPADVVQALLIALGLGTTPPTPPAAAGSWPVYVDGEPNSPDDVIVVTDTLGAQFGRQMHGTRDEHHGVQVLVRSTTHAVGYTKARAIAVALDTEARKESVTVGNSRYCVPEVTRTSDVLRLGKGPPTDRRSRFSINVTTPVTLITP